MRKSFALIAAVAGFAAIGAAAPAMADGPGVTAGDMSLVNLDASDAAKLQVCGQNVLAQPGGQECDNAN